MALIVSFIASLTAPHGPAGSFVVSVSVTLPAAISAADGVYVAFKVEALGLNVPAPPLHAALEAAPPTTPASCTAGDVEHTTWSRPAFTVAAGWIVILIWSLTWPHGPPVAFVVSVSVTEPAAISAALGVYLALSVEADGLYVPAPPLHVPPEAPPPTTPASVTCGLLEQAATSAPAFTVAAGE
jgi:hypothetical protein